jgi:hypothetical protein
MEMERNWRENSRIVSFSKMIAPPPAPWSEGEGSEKVQTQEWCLRRRRGG